MQSFRSQARLLLLALLGVASPSLVYAERWVTSHVARPNPAYPIEHQVDADSLQPSGSFIKYRKRSLSQYPSEEVLLADCVELRRGQWRDASMYPVYPGTIGGDEVAVVCRLAAERGLTTTGTVTAQTAPTPRPSPPAIDEWTVVYTASGETNGVRWIVSHSVSFDSIRQSGTSASYWTRTTNTHGMSRQMVVADCADGSRRLAQDRLSYPTSAGTLEGDEVKAVCVYLQGAAVATTAPAAPTETPRPASREPVRPAAKPTPAAEPEVSLGSGFVVGPGLVVTNFHVIDGCSSFRVRKDTTVYRAALRATAERSDLALLTVEANLSPVPSVRPGGAALGEDVVVAGHPLHGLLSSDLVVTSGQVNSLAGMGNDPTLLQISAPVQPGNSGGPLIDRSGAIVGVVVSKLNVQRLATLTGDIAQNVNFAIKPEVLRLFLDSNRVPFRTTQPSKQLSGVEIAQRARGFTVQVICTK